MIRYTVKSGENLYTIANKYGVTAQSIRKWNNLRTNRVPRGKRLTIYIDTGGVSYEGRSTDDSDGERTTTARSASTRKYSAAKARTATARKAAASRKKKKTTARKSTRSTTAKKSTARKKTGKARKRR